MSNFDKILLISNICFVIKVNCMKDLKYLAAFSIPIIAFVSINMRGFWTYATPVYSFVVIPILELILSVDDVNLQKQEVENKLKNKLFDWLLYLNLPIVFSVLIYSLFVVGSTFIKGFEFMGLIISTGIVLGVNGINVAHELGHRQKSNERFLGKLLLLPTMYMHFYIEHNFGHHLNAATKEDPATARYNQSLYSFWLTSIFRQYISAWKIQLKLLNKRKVGFISVYNDMFWFSIFQCAFLLTVYFFFGPTGLLFSLLSSIVGILLLETVNYIEHYGLLRLKTEANRYERVVEKHSWNSNHVIGRIVLYELTRHSDHHYKASKKYQVLDCHEDSPQMPFGYPTSMVLALIPPLWFRIMNKRVPPEMISL